MFSFFIIACCMLSAYYIPSSGGSGVRLSYNLLLILTLGTALLVGALQQYRYLRVEKNQRYIKIGFFLIFIPWIIYIKVSPGCIVLLIAFLYWRLSEKWYIDDETKKRIVLLIFSLALAQSIIAIIQVFSPGLALRLFEYDWLRNQGRPYGIFQQVNLLASFLATGIGCGFLLLMREKRFLILLLYCSGLAGITFVLALNQSRAGFLGMIAILTSLIIFNKFQQKRKTLSSILLMAICFSAGHWFVVHTHIIVNNELVSMSRAFGGSNEARLYILETTLKMIALKPWLGWGYGSYEYEFSRFLTHPDPGYYYDVITHPHNELLFAWFQGGIVALAGTFLLVFGWIKNVIAEWQNKKISMGYSLLVIPLLIHLNLEYPFYQSFIHLTVFVVLLRIGEIDSSKMNLLQNSTNRMATGFISIGLILYGVLALYTHIQLTHYERARYADFPDSTPWYFFSQHERAQYDAMVALLMDYNKTKNDSDLTEFMSRAKKYSTKHNDRNIWLSMISIAQYQSNDSEAQSLRQQYKQLFPEKAE